MMIFTLLAVLLFTNDSAVGDETVESVETYVGQDVFLPCTCPNETMKLSWQRGQHIVNAHPQDNNMAIYQAYVSRTELFLNKERSNCVLLLHNVSWEDAGVYTCYALKPVGSGLWSTKMFNINLTVSENTSITPEPHKGTVSVGVPMLVVVSILTVVLIITLLIRRRRHRTNTDTDIPAQQPMMSV